MLWELQEVPATHWCSDAEFGKDSALAEFDTMRTSDAIYLSDVSYRLQAIQSSLAAVKGLPGNFLKRGAAYLYPHICKHVKSSPLGTAMGVPGEPTLTLPPEQGLLRISFRAVLMTSLGVLFGLPLFLYFLVWKRKDFVSTWAIVMQGVALPKTSVFDAELQERVWATEQGRNYAQALEWQRREGFCSSTTMRCLLNS